VEPHAGLRDAELVETASCGFKTLDGIVGVPVTERDEAEKPTVPGGVKAIVGCESHGVGDETARFVVGSPVSSDHSLDPEERASTLRIPALVP